MLHFFLVYCHILQSKTIKLVTNPYIQVKDISNNIFLQMKPSEFTVIGFDFENKKPSGCVIHLESTSTYRVLNYRFPQTNNLP